jgi:hypothetical protein
VVANFQTVVGERVDALDEMNQWPQRGRHAWWALLRLSSIPIKSNYIARDSTIDAKLLEMILLGLLGIEAATAMPPPETTCALVEVYKLPNVDIVGEIIG